MKISEIITDKYKLRIPPTVYYELLADVREVEEDQEPTTKNDLEVEEVTALAEWITKLTEANKSAYSQGYADGMKAQAEPKTGHWIDTDEWRETVDGFEQWGYFRKCSKCGYVFKFLEIDNYCPNCGAKMAEGEET